MTKEQLEKFINHLEKWNYIKVLDNNRVNYDCERFTRVEAKKWKLRKN